MIHAMTFQPMAAYLLHINEKGDRVTAHWWSKHTGEAKRGTEKRPLEVVCESQKGGRSRTIELHGRYTNNFREVKGEMTGLVHGGGLVFCRPTFKPEVHVEAAEAQEDMCRWLSEGGYELRPIGTMLGRPHFYGLAEAVKFGEYSTGYDHLELLASWLVDTHFKVDNQSMTSAASGNEARQLGLV